MKQLMIAMTTLLLLVGCSPSQEPSTAPPAPEEPKTGLFQEAPLEVMDKSLRLAVEGDIKEACEYVIIEDFENPDGYTCLDAYTLLLGFVEPEDLMIDPESGTVSTDHAYGEDFTLITDIKDEKGEDFGCAVFSDKGKGWKWHILESIDGGCENPPMDYEGTE